MTTRLAALITGVGLTLALAPASVADWEEVPVTVTFPAKIKSEPGESVLVTLARANDNEDLNVGRELSRWLRREISRGSALEVLDVPPPPIPEQPPASLVANDRFWRRLGEDYEADIIVAALIQFDDEDRSGFVTGDRVHPITGQTFRDTYYAELTGFKLHIHIFFFQGDNGALLHHDQWRDERIVNAVDADDIAQLYSILDSLREDLLAIVKPAKVPEPRFIWVE